MLDAYWGEFLINPCALELTLNACSHACAYCFANLNHPDRAFDAGSDMRLLADFGQRHTLPARLLQARYPVVISNRSDPFALSNYRQALPLMELLTGLDIPIMLQTRGGYGVAAALKVLPPSVWYITIETDSDTLARQLSPGAPIPSARLDLAAQLTSMGHSVVVGVNPCVEAWLPDPTALLTRLKHAGVWGVWIEPIHLSLRQVNRLSPTARARIGETVITLARARKRDTAHILATRAQARDLGLEVYSVGQPDPSDFFVPFRRHYPKTFPILQDYVNLVSARPGDLLTFDRFADLMETRLPPGTHGIAHYLATTHDLFTHYRIPHRMTYRQLLSIVWQDASTKFSLTRSPAFAFATYETRDGPVQLIDDHDGLPMLVYNPQGFTDYYVTI